VILQAITLLLKAICKSNILNTGPMAHARFLEPWAEVRGILDSLDEGALYATISGNTIAFPADLITALKPFLGKRLAILRTDEVKPYRWRLLD